MLHEQMNSSISLVYSCPRDEGYEICIQHPWPKYIIRFSTFNNVLRRNSVTFNGEENFQNSFQVDYINRPDLTFQYMSKHLRSKGLRKSNTLACTCMWYLYTSPSKRTSMHTFFICIKEGKNLLMSSREKPYLYLCTNNWAGCQG